MKGASMSDTYPYLQTPTMFVTNDKVGIGTTTPYAKLHGDHGPTYTGIGNDRFRIEELVTNGHRYGLQMGIDWSSGNFI